jgi:RNA polymerase sigma-70 factor (ECF subfamily)
LDDSIDESVRGLLRAGESSWPQLQVTPEQFVSFLARQLPPDLHSSQQLRMLRASDLFLICGLWLRQPAAEEILEARYMPRVHEVLLRLGISAPSIAEIQQDLYIRLFERQDDAIARHGYSGRGELSGWLCTCAVREARRRQNRAQREVTLEQTSSTVLLSTRQTPEMEVLTGQMKEAFQRAFEDSIAALSSRERNLLRYYFLRRLSLEQIGSMYRVSRATSARWVAHAQERLGQMTRERFLTGTEVSAESLPRIMSLIQSRVSIDLGTLLHEVAEHEPGGDGG